MQFRVLGSLEVRRDAATVAIGSRRQRTVLAALLVHAGEVVSVDALADALWSGDVPGDPRNAVQTYVARLRETLGPGAPLVTRSPGYILEVGADEVDALRFAALVAQAHEREADPAAARALLDEALALWRGPAYAEFADGVARAEALRLDELRLAAVEARAAARLRLSQAAEVVGELEALATEHPLRERVVELLMQALAAVDRQADALACYRDYRARLADGTGLEPGRTIRDLEARILRGELGRVPPAVGGEGPAAPPAPPTRVPAAPTALVGREHDVAATRAAVERERVVTLVGAGGVGKTRLALEVAGALERDGSGEVAWVELAAVADPAALEHVVAGALGLDLAGGVPARDALVGALGARAVRLVLDNCEHLLEAVAPLVDALQGRCPNVRVLATSRERLAVDGEHVRHVPPLAVRSDASDGDVPPAVRLFLDRAAAVSGADLTDQHPAVAAICDQLDGLPLAIELAAARTGALSPTDLLAALGEDVTTAVGNRRGRSERHRDLWAVVDWSYRLLTADEQEVFERLSVFAGAFGVDEAHDVCAPAGRSRSETLAQLATLAERSLLAGPVGHPARYRMLRPLRGFARQRLADRGDLDAVADRHATVLTARAEQAAGPPLTEAGRRWLLAALDDVRAVRRRALLTGDGGLLARLVTALHRFDYWRPGTEMLAWADDVLALPGAEDLRTAPQVHAAAATAAWMRGDLDRAHRIAARGVELGAGPDDAARTLAFEALGDVLFFEGRLTEAEAAFREAVRLGRAGGDPDGEVNGRIGAALALAYTGRAADAIEEADAADREAGHAGPAIRAFARYAQGECRAEVAPAEAVPLLEQAVALARDCEAWFVEGVALLTLASLRGRHSAPAEAAPAFAAVLRHWHRSGNWTQQWTTLRNLAELLVRLGVDEPAVSIAAAATTQDSAAPTFSSESDRLGRALATARGRLGTERFEAAQRHGRRLRREKIVELGLSALDGVGRQAATLR